MGRGLFDATIFSRPALFILDCCITRNKSSIGEDATISANPLIPSSRLFKRSFFDGTGITRVPIKAPWRQMQYSKKILSVSHNHDHVPKEQERARPDVRLYQTWRSPSWLYFTKTESTRKAYLEREALSYFTSVIDGTLRLTCMILVLASLGRLHCLYEKANRVARDHVENVSAHLQADVSVGRVVRCNPISGIRVNNVLVSKSAGNSRVPFGRASYVHASFSGYAGLVLYKRPLELNISVNRGAFTVSCPVAAEFVKGPVRWPNEEQIRLLAGGRRKLPVGTVWTYSRLVELGSIAVSNSRIHVECIRQSFAGESVHSVDVVNMSARLNLSKCSRDASTLLQQAGPSRDMIILEGNFLDGGYAHISVTARRSHVKSSNNDIYSLSASAKCSKVKVASIASFLSLPFRLKDGLCSGSVDVELSPSVSLIPSMCGQVEVKSLGMQFDPSPESPELRNVTGKLRFRQKCVILDWIEGDLGSIPLEAKGHIDLVEGFNIESHAKPFDVNRIIETFAVDRFIPVEGSVVGKAIVRGHLNEPCVSGWIKAVGNRVIADRVPLKSAVMTYDWDASAGNLLFPTIQASVGGGGGEITGSGGIYFDMTRVTQSGSGNEKHHVRNPKALFWNPDVSNRQTLPPLPTDDFEIDKWAPCRAYDSMDFMITFSDVHGENLVRWYGQRFSSIAMDPMSRIGGFCRITGHAEDANSQLVWRSTRLRSPEELNDRTVPPTANHTGHRFRSKDDPVSSQRFLHQFEGLRTGCSINPFNDDLPNECARSSRQEDSEFLGGLVLLKLGDLPEARRVKARTTVKGFRVKQMFSPDPPFRDILPRTPNIVTSMDTLFKGTIYMRPSWDDGRAKSSARNIRLDLVSVDGGLAVRKLSLNGVTFKNIISGSLSLSATDISLNLSESHSQSPSSSLFAADYKNETSRSEHAFDVLQVELNAKGLFHMCLKWGSSEVCASMYLNEEKHHVAQLYAKNVSLQQLSGECNPLVEDEPVQGILTTSCALDLTNQVGSAELTVTNLSLGPVCFELVKSHLSLKNGEICMDGAILEYGLSRLELDGTFVVLEDFSDFEWFINVNVDHAHMHDLSLLLQNAIAVLTSQSGVVFAANEAKADSIKTQVVRPRIHCVTRNSNVTYWEVPEGLSFTEQTKWFNQSDKDVNRDVSALFGLVPSRADMSRSTHDSCNNLSGRVSIHYPSQRNRGRRKLSIGSFKKGPLAALANVSLSFNLTGQNWIIGKNKIEQVTVRGFLEDGSLSLEPSELKGGDGLLLKCQGRITSPGLLDGSVSLHRAPVSSFAFFQEAGLLAAGSVDGMFKIKGNISNPKIYGQMLWNNATVNGRFVSHPHADLSCSNGRCIMNIDAAVGRVEKRRSVSASTESPFPADAVRYTLPDEKALRGYRSAAIQEVSSRRKEGIDNVTARFSIPVRLLIHQYVLPKLSEVSMKKELDAIDNQPSFDDDWIFASVEVRRYGMTLLNALMPELGWMGGSSDIIFRLAGTQKSPEIAGFVKLKDGSIRPPWMTHPINHLNGEINVQEFGLLSCKHLSGRCNGRGVTLRGAMFISKRHGDRLEKKLKELQETISTSDSYKTMQNRELQASLNEAVSALRRDRDGIRVDIGGIPTRFGEACEGTISGKLLVTGTVASPNVDGTLLFSEGVFNAGNAFAGTGQSARASSERLPPHTFVNCSPRKPLMISRKATGSEGASTKNDRITQFADHSCNVHLKQLTLNLGRNVRIVHPFLFNVLAGGRISLSGQSTCPNILGKINILSGSVSALPSRWAVRKSESSYISFAHNPNRLSQEPTVKLVLENDTIILRVAECAASTWMNNLSLSDKAGNRIPEKWWADAIHLNDDEKRSTQKIVNLLAGLMINALAVGGEMGKIDWKLFPTHFGDTFQKFSRQPNDKYGAGFQLDQGSYCVESNIFIDKLKGGQIMVKLARVISLYIFGDQSRRFASFEVRLPEL